MFKFKYILIFSFLVFSFGSVFSNLLPGNVIQVGKEKCSFVGDLVQNQLVATLDERTPGRFCRTHLDNIYKKEEFSDRAMLIEFKSMNGDVGLLMVGEEQYFHRQGVLEKLKHKLLSSVKRNKRKLLKILLKVAWVKASDLNVGDKLKGRHGETLFVKTVKEIKFDKQMDFYELSLKRHHTFYLVDTAGNYILTHNFGPITTCVLVGAAILGAIGTTAGIIHGYCSAKNSSMTEGGPTKKEIARKVLIHGAVGGAIGAVAGAVIGLCYYASAGVIPKGIWKLIKDHETVSSILGVNVLVILEEGIRQVSVLIKDDPNKYNFVNAEI